MMDVYKTASYLGKKAKTESGTAFNGGYVTRSMPSSFVFFFFSFHKNILYLFATFSSFICVNSGYKRALIDSPANAILNLKLWYRIGCLFHHPFIAQDNKL